MSDTAAGYDEFGLFHENAAEVGLDFEPPTVSRVSSRLADGRTLSALRWGTGPVEIVLFHGGGQNAHTWDTVNLALGRSTLAIDLPGHGHSADIDVDRPIGPRSFAIDVAKVVAEHAPSASLVVGMSLGGLTGLSLAASVPAAVPRLMMVDITPGADRVKTAEIHAFLAGPESFETFEEILERTVAFNPTRSESSLRRGILHNAYQREDGRWVWRHQRERRALPSTDADGGGPALDLGSLWDDLAELTVPVQLVVGDRSPVVDADDQERFRSHQPSAQIHTVADAGHSIQGDQPLELARLIDAFLAG